MITSLLSSGQIKKGLLLSGEICHLQSSPLDKSAYPLFGDAGTATALEYQVGYEPVRFIFLQMEVGMRLSLSVMGVIDILLITNHWMFIRLQKDYEGHV